MTALPHHTPINAMAIVPTITELFHRINRVLPADQDVLTLGPREKAVDGISKLAEHHFSQAPVLEHGTVVGIFSYRSFAREVATGSDRAKPSSLLVEECMESMDADHFRPVTGEFPPIFGLLDEHDVVLVGSPERLQGILTPMDLLGYLYGVAAPFVLLTEIELGVRGLIRHCVDAQTLEKCVQASLEGAYKGRPMPLKLEEMNFSDYVSMIGHGENWQLFQIAFGGARERVRANLNEAREMRNVVFHLKRELDAHEQQRLRKHREWVLQRCRMVDARLKAAEVKHV